jgi:hypothetical protein
MPELASFGVQVCEAALEERQNTNCELHSDAVRTRRGGTLAEESAIGFCRRASSGETKHKL